MCEAQVMIMSSEVVKKEEGSAATYYHSPYVITKVKQSGQFTLLWVTEDINVMSYKVHLESNSLSSIGVVFT